MISERALPEFEQEYWWALKIDGYNELLQLAFEYDGVNISKKCLFHDGEKNSLLKQRERDARKMTISQRRPFDSDCMQCGPNQP